MGGTRGPEEKGGLDEQQGLNNLLLYFARFPLDQLSPRSTTGTIRLWKSGNAVTVRDDERVSRAFFKLVTEGFLSAPVLDERGRYVGMLDLLDLTALVARLFEQAKIEPTQEQWNQWFEKEKTFWDTRVRDLLKQSNREPDRPVFRGFSVLQAMEIFARTGVHRVPVLDEYQNVVGICTQSMIISLLSQGLEMMGPIRNRSVREMHSQLSQELFSVGQDDKAIDAFRMMMEKRIHGVPVVDKAQGLLVDNISVRDLRGVGTNVAKFKRLFEPVTTFKQLVRQEYEQQTPPKPITVTEHDTIERVIQLMDDGNIHRVYEVQTNKATPVHVISQVDVIRYVLRCAGVPVQQMVEEQSRQMEQAATGGTQSQPQSPTKSQGQQGQQGALGQQPLQQMQAEKEKQHQPMEGTTGSTSTGTTAPM